MKKMLTLSLIATVSALVIAGCSGKSGQATPEHSMGGGYEMPIPSYASKKQLHDAIMKAGEQNGWIMTEFKSNSIIAEKIIGDRSASATVSFGAGSIIIMKDNSTLDAKYDSYIEALQDAIDEALQTEAAH